ncbi:MAG: hypothetical protein AB1330_01905 [Bacillota bacterium]
MLRVVVEPAGNRLRQRILTALECELEETVQDLCRRLGTDEVLRRLRQGACIIVSKPDAQPVAYTVPIYKFQLEARGQWTVNELVEFIIARAEKKAMYLRRRNTPVEELVEEGVRHASLFSPPRRARRRYYRGVKKHQEPKRGN